MYEFNTTYRLHIIYIHFITNNQDILYKFNHCGKLHKIIITFKSKEIKISFRRLLKIYSCSFLRISFFYNYNLKLNRFDVK
jgi:hypothetical protein